MSRRKLSFSDSPLAHPASPIHRLGSRMQDYLHLPDPYPLYVLMASLAANYAEGRPVWLMLVGPPSCGKSELLQSMMSLPGLVEGGSINGVAALLSGSRKKERNVTSTGGLLHEIGARGCLVVKEFNSILSLPHETMKGVLGAFREVYDGNWTRPVGSDGAHRESWVGKMAFLTGCTESVDQHQASLSLMGDRFVYYRYEASDGWPEAFKSLGLEDSNNLSECLQGLVLEFAREINLNWETPIKLPELNPLEIQRIIAFAQIASKGRSSVTRDHFTREVTNVSVGDYPMRLANIFSQVLRSMRYIGVHESDAWRIVGKLALDTIPSMRRLAFLAVLKGASRTSEIAGTVQVSQVTVKRALEELKIFGVVNREGEAWKVSEWTGARLREAMQGLKPHKV